MSNLARVYRKPSLQQEDRLPVSTYDEAVRNLVCLRNREDLTDDSYDLAIQIVADIFWVRDKRLRRDVIVAAREIGL